VRREQSCIHLLFQTIFSFHDKKKSCETFIKTTRKSNINLLWDNQPFLSSKCEKLIQMTRMSLQGLRNNSLNVINHLTKLTAIGILLSPARVQMNKASTEDLSKNEMVNKLIF
jgi:hypothetical protein